jgi:hypothetical protein
MSLKSEVAELIDWLEERTSVDSGDPESTPLPREDWLLVRDDIERAAKAFRSAGDAVADQAEQSTRSVLADLAFDLSNETQSLASRAYLLSRRAKPKVTKSTDELAKELESKTSANKRLTARVRNLESEVERLEAGAPVAQPTPATPKETPVAKGPDDYIESGQKSLATARENLFNVTPAAQSVIAFSEDLEVLNDLIEGWMRVNRRST